MKRLILNYYLPLLLLASCFASMQANYAMDDRNNCYECSCEPLHECAFDVQLQAGVAPIIWTQRGDINVVNCSADPVVSKVLDVPKFSKLFTTPWIIGGQFGYALSCNTRLYAEFDYVQAKSKRAFTLLNINPTESVNLGFEKYKFYEFFVGARYYWERCWWCNSVSPFLGAKIGLRHHNTVDSCLFGIPGMATCCLDEFPATSVFMRNTSFAGGGMVGLDICLSGNWSAVITAEVVASCGPKTGTLEVDNLFQLNSAASFFIGNIQTEIVFPITFGLRYSF